MKDDLNLSGIQQPEQSWWDDLRFGLGPIVIVLALLASAAAVLIGFLN